MDNIKALVEIRRKFRQETNKKVTDINCDGYTLEYTQWVQKELVKKLTIQVVSKCDYCECVEKEVLMLPHSNTPYCAECGKNIKQ